MSTSIDSPVASGPSDGPEDGEGWLQRELARRMAERGTGRGGRHARREVAEPPRGVDHVPRHSVATPGPGSLRPAPIGGSRRPGGPGTPTGTGAWSRPGADRPAEPPAPPAGDPAAASALAPPASAPPAPRTDAGAADGPAPGGRPPIGAAAGSPAPTGPPRDPAPAGATARDRSRTSAAPGDRTPANPGPADRTPAGSAPHDRGTAGPSPADPTPGGAAPGGRAPAGVPPGDRTPADPTRDGPAPADPAQAAPSRPAPAAPDRVAVATTPAVPAVVRPVASPPDPSAAAPVEVLGGPSRAGRPAPRAFRRRPIDVRSILDPAPAEFGGPRFHEPDTYEPPEPQEPDSFGGPRFHEPTPPSPRTPDGLVDAVALGVDLPRPRTGSGTRASGAAGDVLPPRDPARLLADPPRSPDVETTAQLRAVARAEDPDDEDADDAGDLDDLAGDDGVLWTREAVGPAPLVPSAQRTTVVLSERRARARPVRNVETLQDGSVVGDLLRTDLIRSQLGLALRSTAAAALFLGLLPVVFGLLPVVGEIEVLGIRLPWLLLGFAVYPFLWLLGRLHTRAAERIEREFADQVQD